MIQRLQKFAAAGADVLFAPGLSTLDAVRAVCSAVDKPVNVLIYGDLIRCSIDDLAEAGAARISVGGSLAWNAYSALIENAAAIRDSGRFDGASRNKKAVAILDSALT